MINNKPVVAFVCVHNSCRSQIAEALGKHLASDIFYSCSAGTETKPQINQDAVRLVEEMYPISMKNQYSKLIENIPTLLPFSSKLFFKAFSTGYIVPTKGINCIKHIIVAIISTVSLLAFITVNIRITEINNKINPHFIHSFPQYLFANTQVSLFFIDILVL